MGVGNTLGTRPKNFPRITLRSLENAYFEVLEREILSKLRRMTSVFYDAC